MKKLILICTVLSGVIAGAGVLGAADANEKIKVMFLRGGGVHDWRNCTPILASVLEKTNDFEITFTENLDDLKERIKQYDIIIQYTTGMQLAKEQEKGLCDFIQNGGGYVGIHSASDSFKNADRYWEMLGGRFAGHGGGKFMVHIYDRDHVITKGMRDFEIQDETYAHNYHRNAQMRSLTRMNRGKERQSMSWVSSYGKGRVFYTGNGHGREAWTNPHFQRLVVRATYWAAVRKVKDPPKIR
jgi:type 1 glutamine amidotransferase